MSVTNEAAQSGSKEKKNTRAVGYQPSDPVKDAQHAADQVANHRPSAYSNAYAGQMEELLGKILDRPGFSYDPQSDPAYLEAKSRAEKMGKAAMEDTMGQAAALTGGYASSYSQNAGQQAYGSYLQKLSEMVPELYEQALALYDREGEQLLDQYSLLSKMEEKDYKRYSDSYGRWLQEYGLAQDRYESDRDLDFRQYMAMLEYLWKQEGGK